MAITKLDKILGGTIISGSLLLPLLDMNENPKTYLALAGVLLSGTLGLVGKHVYSELKESFHPLYKYYPHK